MARRDADRTIDQNVDGTRAASASAGTGASTGADAGAATDPRPSTSTGRLGPIASKRWRLEPRVLLDAAVPVTLGTLDSLGTADAFGAAGISAQTADARDADAAAALIDALAPSAATDAAAFGNSRNELVIVDTSISGWRDLLSDTFGAADIDAAEQHGMLRATAGDRALTLLLVDADEDGLGAIERALGSSDTRFSAMHILSHATEGELRLGDRSLDAATLAARAQDIAAWSAHLTPGADVLLYGCDLTAGDDGIAFVRSLAALTGTDVAASDDLSGSAALGGDWELETSTGAIETASIIGTQAAQRFDGVLAATPLTSVDTPAEEFINETVRFTVTFDNTGADTGYAPYFDLVVPVGITGVGAGDAFATDDVPLTLVGTWDTTANGGAGGWRDASNALVTTHPYGSTLALPAGSRTGDTWSIADLPFGSYTQSQPAVVTTFSGALNKAAGALVGQALTITARGGFRFGLDALDNPTADAPLQQGASSSDSVTPEVIRFTKTNDAAESEVASGPNDPITYTLRVDVANGETVTLAALSDQLPGNLQYVEGSLAFVTAPNNGSGTTTLVADTVGTVDPGGFRTPVGGAPQTGANALLTLNYGTIVGRAGDDIVVTYRAFVPEFDAAGARVIPSVAGTDATVTNNASTTAVYDPDGTGGMAASTLTETQTNVLTAKPIAIQKGVTVLGGTPLPGAGLEYTLAVQVSDFFALDNLVLDDRFSDGQVFDASFIPTYVLVRDGVTVPGTFAGANFMATRDTGGDGGTAVQFRLSNQFVSDGLSPRLAGDLFAADAAQVGQTTVLITFRTTIEQDFLNVPGAGDTSVDLGDVLTNTVTQRGRIIQDNLTPGADVDDNSGTSVTIESIEAQKSVFAVEGSTSFTNVRVGPGETVTYRIRLELPSADVESLVIGDFLPLPVFDIGELDPDVNGMATILPFAAGAPAAGEIRFGPDHLLPTLFNDAGTMITLPTTVLVDRANNRFSIDFGSFDDGGMPGGGPYVIDLLYTFTATDRPFADGLLLTNNATVALNNTESNLPDISRIAQIQVSVPTLTLTKGAVATDATTANTNESTLSRAGVTFGEPGVGGAAAFTGTITSASLASAPITSDLTGVDAGDLVTFAIVVENTGSNDAFDLVIRDTLPSDGLRVPPGGLNLKVTDGAGNAIAFTGDLFAGGIELTDPDDTIANELGAIASRTSGAASGTNLIVVTYDLEVSDAPLAGTRVIPNATFANTAELVSFGGRNNGNDFTDGAEGPWTDTASARVHVPVIAKVLVGSAIDLPNNAANQAAIGELITYRVTLTLPEGTHPGLQIVDSLDAGLSFVEITSVAVSTGVASTVTLDASTLNSGVALSGATETGRTLVIDLGTVTNSESDNTGPETITIEYTVRATDIPQNNAGDMLNNSARPRADLDGNTGNGAETNFAEASAANVTILEPNLDVAKTIAGGTRDGGSNVTYTVTISNIAGATGTDAYGVTFADVLPAGLNGAAGVVSIGAVHNNGGVAPTLSYVEGTRTVSASAFDLQEGHSVTLTITTTIEPGVASRATIANTGTIAWTSLPGADPFERTSNDASTVNFTVAAPTIAKTRIDTSVDNASNSETQAVVGEEITYRIVVTVPEVSLPTFAIRDLLDVGLDFVAIDSVTTSSGITSTTIADLNDVTLIRAATTVTNLGTGEDRITIALGTVTNSNSADGVADTITIIYRARVQDIPANVAGVLRNNQAEIRNDRNSDGDNTDSGEFIAQSSAPNTTIIQPSLDVQKDVVTTTRDAGSSITYNITITNATVTNGTKAFDVTLSDVLPAGLVGTAANVSVSAQVVGGSALTASYTEGTRTIAVSAFDLELGQSATVTITAEIADNLDIAAVIDNTANIGWSTLPGSAPGVERTFTDSDGASFALATPTIAKSLVDTSQNGANNTSNEVVIGELVTYELRVTLPENTVPRLTLRDVLDAGLEFVEVVSVTTPTGVSGATTTLNLAGVAAGASTTGTVAGGQTLTIALGDVRNVADSDGTAEVLVIRYTARVADISANTAGDALNNSVALLADLNRDGTANDSFGTAAAANVSVLEPVLTVTKDVSAPIRDTGSPVTYTIVLTNTNVATGTDAYDLVFSDTLPAGIDQAATRVSVSAMASTGAAPTVTYDEMTGLISASGFDLAQGQTVTITVNAFIGSGIAPSTTVDNTANLTWTTLPGNVAGERTSSASDDASFVTTNPSLTKMLVDTSIDTAANDDTEATIGELLTYEVTIRLPEATSPGVLIDDTLDIGLEFVGITAVTASGALDSSTITLDLVGVQSAASTTGNATTGQHLVLALGDVTNTDLNDAAAETITIRYQVRVANIAAVSAGASLNNAAALLLDLDGNGSSTDAAGSASAAPVTVIEQRLTLEKSVDDATASLGQRVTYTFTIAHATPATVTDADAFDIRVQDSLPAGMTLDIGSIRVVGATASSNDSAGNSLDLTLVTLAPGATATVTFEAVIADVTTLAGSSLANTGQISWTTLPGADASERNGNGGGVNDLSASDGASLVVTAVDLATSKSDSGVTTAPGGVVAYTLNYANNGTEDATGVVLREVLPANTTFNAAASTTGWTDVGGGAWEFTVGNVPANGSGSVTFAVTVNPSVPAGFASLTNSVSIRDDGTNGSELNPADNTAGDTTPVTAAPDYTITKTSTPALPVEPGETLPYSLTITNLGNEGGTGVTIVDTFDPALLQVNPASIVTPAGVTAVVDNMLGTITFTVTNDALVTAGNSFAITYDTVVASTVAAGVTVIDGPASISGANEVNLANNSDDDLVTLTAQPDYRIAKSSSNTGDLQPGDTFTYTVTVDNIGNQGGTGVTVTDMLPASLLDTGALTISDGGTFNPGTGQVTWNLGSLAAGATRTLTVTATVIAAAPAGTSSIANTATVADDGANGSDPTPGNNTATDTDPLLAAPDYSVTKTSTPALPVEPGETLPYTLTIANLGNEDGTGVTIVDTFDPALLQVNPASIVTPAGVTAVVDNMLGTITFTVTNDALVTAGNSFAITYDTVVASTVAAGVTVIDGPASISGANEVNLANNSDDDIVTLTAQPDYRIAKSSSNAVNLVPGETFTYTVTVDNIGNQGGTGVVVTDALPVAVLRTDTLIISDGGSFDPGTGQITWNLGSLAAGATRTLTVEVTLRATVPPATDAQNSASVTDDGANGTDPTPGNNTATDNDLIDAAPDYTVTKTNNAAVTPAMPGDSVPFTLVVTNLGREDGTGVTIVDRFDPTVLTVNAASIVAPAGVTAVVDNVAGTITFTVTDDTLVRGGNSFTITYDSSVKSTVPAGVANVAGTATISGANESNLANNTDPDVLPLTAQPDYRIAKSSSNSGNLQPGDTFTYTVTVDNVGNQTGTGVVVTDSLPVTVLRTDALVISDGGTLNAGTGQVTWNVASLAAGASRTFTVTATLLAGTPAGMDTVTNTASVTDDGANGSDPTPGNNTATDIDPLFAAPDYTVTKANNATLPLVPGADVPFTLSVANLGNEDGTGASIIDRFDPALLQVDPASIVTPAGVTAVVDNTTGTITFTITDNALVAAGSRFDITYVASVAPRIPAGAEVITGTATIAGDNETNLANNSDPDAIPLTAHPDYALTKTSTPRLPVEPGESVPYRLTLVNMGNQDGTTATIVDRFDASLVTLDPARIVAPAGVTLQLDATAGTLTLTVTDATLLRVGATFDVTYEATLRASLPAGVDELPNRASVTGAGDINPGNDNAGNLISLTALPDYVVSKQSDAGGMTAPGSAITYTIVVRNDGNQDGTNVVVSDVLPTAVLGAPTAISNGGTYDASTGTIRWVLPTLAADAQVTLTFSASVVATAPAGVEAVANRVSVTDDGRNGADPNPEDNTAGVQDLLDAAPDYAVTKVRDAIGGLAPGDTVEYRLVVSNHGSQAGSNVILTDLYDPAVLDITLGGLTLPAGVTASIDATTGTLSFRIADGLVEAGDSLTILVSGTVRGPAAVGSETVTNIAVITGDGDTQLEDNQARTSDPLLAAPDYSVQKSNNAAFPVTPGSRIDFTLDIANIGNQDGSNAVIVDTFDPTALAIDVAGIVLPPGITVTVDNIAGTITFRVTDDTLMAAGEAFRIVIPTTVLGAVPLAAEDIDSVVRIVGDNDGNLANNVDTDSIPLSAAPDLAIAKSALETSVTAGGTVTYTLRVVNDGNQDATGVRFVDTYDAAALTILSVTPIDGTAASGVTITDDGAGNLRFTVTDDALVQAGDALTYRIVARAADPVELGTEALLNTATVTAPGDGNLGNNSASASTPLLAASDYSVRKTSTATGSLAPGDTIQYSLLVRNEGNQDGSAVFVTDVFSPTTVAVDADSIDVPDGVVVTIDAGNGTITFQLPNTAVEAGDQLLLRYSVTVRATVAAGTESLLNTAIVRGQDDGNATNDSSEVQLGLDASADVGITITDNLDTIAPGDTPSFEIVIDNLGNQDAAGVTARVTYDPAVLDVRLADIVLPAGVTVSQPEPGVLVFEVGTLTVDAAALNITVPTTVLQANAGVTGSLVQASVSASEDTNPANDTAFDLDTLAAAPDYSITKQSSNTGALRPGDALTYTLTVRNAGNQDGTGVVVTDTLPPGLSRAGLVISDGGTFDAGTGRITWNIGDLDVGASRTLTVTTSVLAALPAGIASIMNLASVTDDGTNGDDPTPGNNQASDVDAINATPDLRVDVNDGVDIAQRGDTVTYTLDIANTGSQGATGTTVVFRFPPGSLVIGSTSIPGVVDAAAGTIAFDIGALPAGAAQRISIVATVADTAVPDPSGRIAVQATITDDGTNGADPTPANNADTESLQFIDDQRNVVFFTDNGRQPHDPGIPDGDRLRIWEYEEQPQWLHGRLISLETMQTDANLMGGRTEVKFDAQFGHWNHQFFPNPWNHDRADFAKNAEWLDEFVHWLGAQASELGDDMVGASLEKQIDAAIRGDRGTLLRHLSKLAGAD